MDGVLDSHDGMYTFSASEIWKFRCSLALLGFLGRLG